MRSLSKLFFHFVNKCLPPRSGLVFGTKFSDQFPVSLNLQSEFFGGLFHPIAMRPVAAHFGD